MVKLVALNNQQHRKLRVDPAKIEEQGADLHMVPVVTSEFLKLVVHFPILFTKNAETGQFVSVCLMGLEEGENLFWQGGKMHCIYTPLNITRHPFFVGQDEQSGDQYVLCIDEQSEVLSELHSEALFDEQGQATDYLQKAQARLAELINGEQASHDFIEVIKQMDLMVPLSLDITYADGESRKIKGVYSVDEEKLANLDGEKLTLLRDAGYLSLIYTQLASLGQIYNLIDKKNQRLGETSPWFKASGA